MRKILVSTAAGLTLFSGSLALAAGFTGTANAQPTGDPSAQPKEQGEQGGRQHRRGRIVKAAVKTAADTIGIDVKTLVSELEGKSVAQVAQAHGTDPQTVIDALVTKGNEAIDKAVAAGKLDAEKAATLKEKLPAAAERAVNHVFDGSRLPRRGGNAGN